MKKSDILLNGFGFFFIAGTQMMEDIPIYQGRVFPA